jgi:hypothetical protein
VVAGAVLAVTTYLDLERQADAEQALMATIDRLYVDQQLSVALKTIHDGKVDVAATQLDLLLCSSILRLDADLSADNPRVRAYVDNAFRRIALLRPKTVTGANAGATPECNSDQVAAERILTLALGTAWSTQPQ